jgi:hypothetical protein
MKKPKRIRRRRRSEAPPGSPHIYENTPPPPGEAKAAGHASARLRTKAASNAVVEPPLVVDQDTFPAPKVQQHEEMLSRIALLERLMAELQRPGIGHNQPLPDLPFGDEEVREITKAIAILKAQPVVPKQPNKAKAAASILKKIGERLGTYVDTFFSNAAKSAGDEFGKWLTRLAALSYLADKLGDVAQSVTNWLQ